MSLSKKSASFMTLAVAALALGSILVGTGNWGVWARSSRGEEKWKPGSASAQAEDFAGTESCAECHGIVQATQKTTEMANTAMRPAESSILTQHTSLIIEQGSYTYSIQSVGQQVIFSVSDAHAKITEPVVLAVGAGIIHQSYLIQHNGDYYQLPVSYYTGRGRLLWVGQPAAGPASLEATLGERLTADRIRACMGCHGTPKSTDAPLAGVRSAPGITCEACHGGGAKHVAAMRAGRLQNPQIFDPSRLTSSEEMEFCGECHHLQDVKNGSVRGMRTVLSQPYRLMESRCWNPNDKRSRCTFCHNPHRPMEQETVAYDTQCLSCHAAAAGAPASAAQPGKACPVGRQNCAGCHMPQVEIPGSHASYTDHRIRIIRAGAPYPE